MIDNTAFGQILDDGTLRFERLLPGPIERVWSYLTKSELLATWIGPLDIPAAPGAAFVHTWAGGGVLQGRVRIYQPPTILEYEWNESDAPGGPLECTVVRFELAPQGGLVRLILTHRLLPRSTFVTVGAGWHAHADALIAALDAAPAVDPDQRYAALEPDYRARLDAAG